MHQIKSPRWDLRQTVVTWLFFFQENQKLNFSNEIAAPLTLLIAAFYVPETPSYLSMRGREDEAALSLQWLRGEETDISQEWNTIQNNVGAQKNRRNSPSYASGIFPLDKRFVRPLLTTCGVMMVSKSFPFSIVLTYIFHLKWKLGAWKTWLDRQFVNKAADCLTLCVYSSIGCQERTPSASTLCPSSRRPLPEWIRTERPWQSVSFSCWPPLHPVCWSTPLAVCRCSSSAT